MKGSSKQTVVIQTGMTCSFYDWLPIIEKLSQHFTVVSYHRPGYGKSELGNDSRTIRQVTKELHMLLQKLAIHEPIILIGHSYGGLCAQHFTMLHEDKLQALILVDSTSMNLHRLDELHLPISDQTDSDDMWLQKYNTYSKMDVDMLSNELKPILANQSRQYIEFSTSPTLYKATASELSTWKNCARSIKELYKTLEVPLIVIGRDPQYSITQLTEGGMQKEEATQLEAMWQELIHEQLQLSINSQYILAEHAGHGIENDRPDIIIEAVQSVRIKKGSN
ncbi:MULTISPECIES: alpha/beta fold hydrolase [Bacillus cereus group]|uniref:alpha/beta hydrolase n=1 Tax=Bacillus cereus group TaxID=86661 RepID=UPI0009175446|nr:MULTISPECIES: alpha/beta hydrolase [Bacillus cereus group]MCH5437742.1 alpha/beta hydrolase [Bacillus paranthracis]MCU5172537.1 alpha/beta hydrolase [Bacillus paranthracis]MCU5390886.1 alpha/beta hydrolase [Bacillus paranthracis]MDA1617271.1 alpha/beta hydrolase [Bacillus cereus group sp. TH204-1LC]MDX5882032.1 alpha/beta hydrolase [Bacillus cereus group sp. BfR-BA-00999]